MTATRLTGDDRLLAEFRRLKHSTRGRGMSTVISGEHLAAVDRRISQLEAELEHRPPANGHRPVERPWQAMLGPVVQILDSILQDPECVDLRGVNTVDALSAWAARNDYVLSEDVVSAVNRALSGG